MNRALLGLCTAIASVLTVVAVLIIWHQKVLLESYIVAVICVIWGFVLKLYGLYYQMRNMTNKEYVRLYSKYGNYNKDGYFIISYERWEYYDRNPKAYARVKRNASLWAMVPFVGMVMRELLFNKMGLQT
jgi:hypothetical protein